MDEYFESPLAVVNKYIGEIREERKWLYRLI